MAGLDGVDLKELDSLFGSKIAAGDATPNKSTTDKTTKIDGVNLDDLDAAFGLTASDPKAYTGANLGPLAKRKPSEATPDDSNSTIRDGLSGALQGAKDIVNSGAQGIGYIDNALSKILPTDGAKRNADFNARLDQEEAALPKDNTAFDVGRMGGQIIAGAPLAAAVPEMAVAKSIPYVGKGVASALRGAVGGGMFGAATNASNDQSLASNVGTNAAFGAAAGPLVDAGANAASKAVSGLKGIVEKIRVNNIVRDTGIDPNAARNTLSRLQEAGYSPSAAEARLRKLGPNATMGDLAPSLQTEVGGLASFGGKPTDTLKGRYGERAAGANSAAHDLMETRLGAKPDLQGEKEAIHNAAQSAVAPDYSVAHASKQALDVQPIVDGIDSKLKTAVGDTRTTLEKVRSYLHDNEGNVKADIEPLHAARQEIDANLKKLERDGESQSPAYRALNDVRNKVDAQLKSNPEMASADAKFAQHMDVKEGLDIGYKAMDKSSFDNFQKAFNVATPEKQEAIRKGLRAKIGDLMEKATRGELSEAQRLFGKSTNNRKIVTEAFGQNGDDVLTALEREANERGVERSVGANSLTAERRAVQERPEYGGRGSEAGILGSVAQGAMADAVTGTPGVATAIGAGKGIISGLRNSIQKERIEKTVEGTADLLSRQEKHGRSEAVDILDRIEGVSRRKHSKLPVDYSGIKALATRASTPAAIPSTKRLKSAVDDFRGMSN